LAPFLWTTVYVPDLKSLVTKNGKAMQKVENGMVWVSSESLKVTENSTIHRAHTSSCYRPIVTNVPILHSFWDIARYCSKMSNFNLLYPCI